MAAPHEILFGNFAYELQVRSAHIHKYSEPDYAASTNNYCSAHATRGLRMGQHPRGAGIL